MQLAFVLVRIIYDTITSVLFWAYDFPERMILCAYDLYVYDLSGRMIFFLSVFVCVWFFCAYDFHDDAPVPVAYHKKSNKWTMYSDFLNFHLWNLESFYSLLHLLGGVHVWFGGRGLENGPYPPDTTFTPPIIWGIFQSTHGGSSFTTVYIVDLTPSRHVLATRIT